MSLTFPALKKESKKRTKHPSRTQPASFFRSIVSLILRESEQVCREWGVTMTKGRYWLNSENRKAILQFSKRIFDYFTCNMTKLRIYYLQWFPLFVKAKTSFTKKKTNELKTTDRQERQVVWDLSRGEPLPRQRNMRSLNRVTLTPDGSWGSVTLRITYKSTTLVERKRACPMRDRTLFTTHKIRQWNTGVYLKRACSAETQPRRATTHLENAASTGGRQTGHWPLVNQVQSLQSTRSKHKLEAGKQDNKQMWKEHSGCVCVMLCIFSK